MHITILVDLSVLAFFGPIRTQVVLYLDCNDGLRTPMYLCVKCVRIAIKNYQIATESTIRLRLFCTVIKLVNRIAHIVLFRVNFYAIEMTLTSLLNLICQPVSTISWNFPIISCPVTSSGSLDIHSFVDIRHGLNSFTQL